MTILGVVTKVFYLDDVICNLTKVFYLDDFICNLHLRVSRVLYGGGIAQRFVEIKIGTSTIQIHDNDNKFELSQTVKVTIE